MDVVHRMSKRANSLLHIQKTVDGTNSVQKITRLQITVVGSHLILKVSYDRLVTEAVFVLLMLNLYFWKFCMFVMILVIYSNEQEGKCLCSVSLRVYINLEMENNLSPFRSCSNKYYFTNTVWAICWSHESYYWDYR